MQIMFKMDMNGNGVLIEKNDLPKAVKLRPDLYTFDKFRHMCIMSGCDYLPSLPGIGLMKAGKVFQLTRQTDMTQVLSGITLTSLVTFKLFIGVVSVTLICDCIYHGTGV